MRLEDYLSQSYAAKSLTKYQKQPEAAAFSPARTKEDTVDISAEAKAAQRGGGYFTNSPQEAGEAKQAFKAYMDRATGRVPSSAKTPEEKMKELTEKIKQLQAQLSDVMANESLSDSVKSGRVNTLTAQINEAYARLAEIGKELGRSAEGESAEV